MLAQSWHTDPVLAEDLWSRVGPSGNMFLSTGLWQPWGSEHHWKTWGGLVFLGRCLSSQGVLHLLKLKFCHTHTHKRWIDAEYQKQKTTEKHTHWCQPAIWFFLVVLWKGKLWFLLPHPANEQSWIRSLFCIVNDTRISRTLENALKCSSFTWASLACLFS